MHIRAHFEISHGGNAINSLDFHPTGQKLVTGGHGSLGIAGEIKIWDISGVNSKKDINVLGTANFQYGVNCVRFSLSGKEIAVADDGKTITILRLQSRTKNAEGKISEIYRPAFTVLGHEMEVLHVEFSPTSAMLASTSIDGCCKIWNMKNMSCLAVLDEKNGGHKEGETVKGCSWDPMEKFLATQSSDRSLKIWKTFTWECVWTLTEPFLESSQSTMFTRMDWSPDGALLVVPSTVNNSGPTAQIIMRKDWTFEKDLVGHRRPLACVAFSKELRIFTDEKNRKYLGYVVAIGGRDRTLSVWQVPKARRPIVVITEIVKLSIVDMKWYGKNLAISSLDGSTRFVIFKESEIGIAASENELNQHCIKIYGFGLPSQSMSLSTDSQNAENDLDEADQWSKKISDIFSYTKKEEPKAKPAAAVVAAPVPPPLVQAANADNQGPTMVVRTKVGKKRIMTTFLGGLEEVEETTKISKTTDQPEFPERHSPSSAAPGETVAAEKVDDENTKNFLRTIKYNYEVKKPNKLIIHNNDDEIIYFYDEYEKHKPLQMLPYYGINFYDDNNSRHLITITNEITDGIEKKVARIWNLKENVNTQIDGHVLGCTVNRQFLILVKENNALEIIDRDTQKSRMLSQLPETPELIKVYGDWLIVLFANQTFLLFNISSPSSPLGQICKGSLAAFKNQKGQFFAHNGLPMFISNSEEIYIASFEKQKWIQAAIPSTSSMRFPSWLFPKSSITKATILNRIISQFTSFNNQRQSSQQPPSDHFVPALVLPSEFQFFTFVRNALKTKTPPHHQCKHFKEEDGSEKECQTCQLFYLFTNFSMNCDTFF